MRVLKDRQDCTCAQVLPCSPTTQHYSLEDAGKLWAEWGIHGLILVSFGLQVFLFLAAGMRRRSASRIRRSLLWLAYLTADSVAIFILGHLAVHASGPHHQLLFFWAPFVLLHLGGQHTITAFSMQDNELWRRHLLGLVTQVVVAAYVVSRTSWPDRRLLAAMVLMFLAGCLSYAERTLCLYNASPVNLKGTSLSLLFDYERMDYETRHDKDRDSHYKLVIDGMLNADGRQRPVHSTYMRISYIASALVSDPPVSVLATSQASPSFIQGQLEVLRSSADRCRAYNYVGAQLVQIYELLYTKAPVHYYFCMDIGPLLDSIMNRCLICVSEPFCLTLCWLALSLLVLFPFFATTSAMVLFVVTEKSPLYGQVDVIVSYILLIGAITLEVASLFMAFAPHTIRSGLWSVATYIRTSWGTKEWSEMLGQYNIINRLTKQPATGITSFVPQWISKHLEDKPVTHIHIYEELKKLVLDKLLEFGTRQENWDFASYRGQIALRDRNMKLSPAGSEAPLYKSINDADFVKTMLIWHMATDILYFQDNNTNDNNSCQQMKKMSRELSNYIMYLVFKRGVMLTNSSELQHLNAHMAMMKARGLSEMGTMKGVLQAIQLPTSTSETPFHRLLSHACEVAQELTDIPGEAKRWDLIAAVWLEMLFYIAPRCGGAFHSAHLATGGEFISHVLLLMQLLGPFLKPLGM